MACPSNGVPKIVWMLWFQGWERAPHVCKMCKKSFELWNPGWEVRALDEQSLPDVLDDYCKQFTEICKANNPLASLGLSWIPPAAAADVLRLFLLIRYGGVWADATVLCRRPLDEWIHAAAAPADGFFAFGPEKGEEIPIMSSFLASRAQHPLLEAWQEKLHRHWKMPAKERPNLEYFWFHVLFGKLVQENATAKDLWQRARNMAAEYKQPGPHRFMPYEEVLVKPPDEEFKRQVENVEEEEPVLKLTIHDVKYNREGRDVLHQRDGSDFRVKASQSSFEYLMQRTLEKARQRHADAPEFMTWKPEVGAYRKEYGLSIDAVLLQNMPESRRSHASVLFIWLAVAVACCVEVWVCAGATAGVSWLSGYLMELLYSADHVFVMQLVFSSLDTPHRLMSKALYVSMISTMTFRFLGFVCGVHWITPVAIRASSWMLGFGLVYAGICRLGSISHGGVSECMVLRLLRSLMGERLAEFYDEEGEAWLVEVKGKVRMTLLGVVLICLVSLNFALNFDVVLAKSEASQDAFLNFSSSALALFAIRSLFFVVRDFFNMSNLTRSTFAVVLLLMGLEMLGGHAVYVSALISIVVFACMLVLSVGISSLQHPIPKMPLSDLHSF
ncbi:hypothetical protein AK812_SmicGene11804 [Symbiodinium microadriaticum]|uniref:Uncharacterized protein n=1 Tax=Symbiodinium microadriaticum TaxID=2951 RepID=A0A1Q9EC93_SYMMI|nr:hypothetical protein AK812_SmicGene11804 [Symbiodinium microadriaticum]